MAKSANDNETHFRHQRHVAILDLFTALLEDEGYRVTTDGFSIELGDMLGRVRAVRPDLLVLDPLIQDEGKGWQFLQMLHMDRATRDVPVIVCTAAAKLVEELQTHLDTMKVSVVLKPFDIDHLLAVIDKMWASRGVRLASGESVASQGRPASRSCERTGERCPTGFNHRNRTTKMPRMHSEPATL